MATPYEILNSIAIINDAGAAGSGLFLNTINAAELKSDDVTVLAHKNDATGEVVRFDLATAVGKLNATAIKAATDGLVKDMNVTKDANVVKFELIKADGSKAEKTLDLSSLVTFDIHTDTVSFEAATSKLIIHETNGVDKEVDLSKLKNTAEVNDGITTIKQGDTTVTTTYTPEKVRELIAAAKEEAKLKRYSNTDTYTAGETKTHTINLGVGMDYHVQITKVLDNGQEEAVIAPFTKISETQFTVTSSAARKLKVVAF